MSRPALLAVIALAIAGVTIGAFAVGGAGLISNGDVPRLIYLLCWLILIVGGGAYLGSGQFGALPAALRNAAIWLAILLAIMGGYVLFLQRSP